jgi:hypothetical protein
MEQNTNSPPIASEVHGDKGLPPKSPVPIQRKLYPDGGPVKAHLHPPIRKTGVPYTGRYDVTFDGEIIVKGSRDPETDLARALLAQGITGTVMVVDANTGKHRTTVNIQKAAKLKAEEGPHGPRFVRFQETVVERPHAGETLLPGIPLPEAVK